MSNRAERDHLVEGSLRAVGLWDEVTDRLRGPGLDLSGSQQQRLCITRALATEAATALFENLVDQLRERYTIVIVTHNMQRRARVAANGLLPSR